jgi:nicotinamidase-related amidase
VIDKQVYPPFFGSQLPELLRRCQIDSLITTGAETDVCVLATVLDAVDLGSASSSRPMRCAVPPTQRTMLC